MVRLQTVFRWVSRCSPHACYVYAGKTVTVRETLDGGILRIFHQQDRIAEHSLAVGKGAMVTVAAHYGNLPRRERAPIIPTHQTEAHWCSLRAQFRPSEEAA